MCPFADIAKMEQRVFIVNYGNGTEELNKVLAAGWVVKEIHTAPASASTQPYWLVLAQKGE